MNILKLTQAEVLTPNFDCQAALTQAALCGYAFFPEAISPKACDAMEEEVSRLDLEAGDYTSKPIKEYKRTRVTQRHERFYRAVGDWQVPVASLVSAALIHKVGRVVSHTPCLDDPIRNLANWAPTEAGYQRYRTTSDHISPHRDRRTDQLLGATFTINGSALVRIHRPLDDLDDYYNLNVIDEFETSPGSLMLLRAPGFASGEQAIHEVLPPSIGRRLILNLRMRPDVLKSPRGV